MGGESYKDIRRMIIESNEEGLKKMAIEILEGVIDGTVDKDPVSYFESFFITIPMELGWNDNYKFKDKVLDDTYNLIANFESYKLKDAKEKSKGMLEKLRNRKMNEKESPDDLYIFCNVFKKRVALGLCVEVSMVAEGESEPESVPELFKFMKSQKLSLRDVKKLVEQRKCKR